MPSPHAPTTVPPRAPPLLAVISPRQVVVLHGGVDDDVDITALAAIPRDEYVVNASNSAAASGGRQGFIHPHMRAKMEEIKKRDLQVGRLSLDVT